MFLTSAVSGCAVREVDGISGREGDGFCVEIDGFGVVFLLHCGVALRLEGLGFRVRGAWPGGC